MQSTEGLHVFHARKQGIHVCGNVHTRVAPLSLTAISDR